MTRAASELHPSHRSSRLRADVLGADDGLLSTASIVLGVAASGASGTAVVTAGIAGLMAGEDAEVPAAPIDGVAQ